ncbi:unnamed protein product, partial [Symbiodinium pilosum]
MEAARRGAAEAREALRQSAEVGQLLLSRNEALEQELEVLRRSTATEASQRQRLEEECRRLELELERDGKARRLRFQSVASADSDEELSMEQMKQRLKRSEQSEQEHREAACLAEEHAAAFEEKHQKLEEEYRRLQVECRQLRSRRSMRTSSPGHEVREEEEKEDLARQRWRRAGTEVVKRLSAGSLSFEEPSPSPKPPSPTSVTSPSRRSERNEELEQQLSNLAMERDAARAEKAASESHAQQLEDEATTLRLLLEEEAQRTEALVQQVDYLADLLEERQAQSGAQDMLKSLGLSREPSPERETLSTLDAKGQQVRQGE